MKQMIPTCLCGQPMQFQPGETKTRCKTLGCGVLQELKDEGYWAKGLTRSLLTPIFTKKKLNHYERYMAWRNKKRGVLLNAKGNWRCKKTR